MSNIHSLPELERPREKAKHYGISSLSNIELLAILINQGPRNSNAFNVAYDLLSKCGDISKVFDLSYQELTSIKGISDGIAFKFLSIQELIKRKGKFSIEGNYISSEDIGLRYSELIGDDNYESMYLIGLRKDKIIYEKQIYKGTSSSFYIKENEIIELLIKENIIDFIIVHNHPSGNPNPSDADILSTSKLFFSSKEYDLNLIDHIIVSSQKNYYSFLDNGLFKDWQ